MLRPASRGIARMARGSARCVVPGEPDGRGNAKDTVVYKVTVSYPRMFPLNTLVSLISPTVLSPTTTLEAKTVLANQPYGDQADPTVRYCT